MNKWAWANIVILGICLVANITAAYLIIFDPVPPVRQTGAYFCGVTTFVLLAGYTLFVWTIARIHGHRDGFRDGANVMASANGGQEAIDRLKAKIRVEQE